jgi:transposase
MIVRALGFGFIWPLAMVARTNGAKWLTVTDMRKGIAGLAALPQDVLRQTPTGGAVFAFRGRRGDRLKLLYWDGQGFCLYYKVLERGRFAWPTASEGAARLTCAQLAMLWEGMDWRRPDWGAPPVRVG